MKLVSPGLERSAFLLKYNNIKNKWCNFSFKHYYFILFGLFVKKIYIYGFIRALCHGNVENGMSPEKIPLFETSL